MAQEIVNEGSHALVAALGGDGSELLLDRRREGGEAVDVYRQAVLQGAWMRTEIRRTLCSSARGWRWGSGYDTLSRRPVQRG